MSEFFRTYRHEQSGFTLPVPAEWEVAENLQGCALVAVEPEQDPRRFVANVVVTVESLAEDEPLESWVRRSHEALRDGTLPRLRIIDTVETEVGGLPAWRTLSHYLHQMHGGVNLDQWQVAHEGWGYVMSCSMGALDYDELADAMERMADGLRIEGTER